MGAGTGQYEVVSRSCSGDFLSSKPVPFQTVGAEVEYERSPLRVTAFGGYTSADASDHDGAYIGGLFAFEGGSVGAGFGVVRLPGDETVPSLYLRFGNRETEYFQTDLFPPSTSPGVTGLARAGVGFGIGATRGLTGLSAGRSLDLSDRLDNGGPFAEFDIPLSASLDVQLAGSWFFSEQFSDWAVGAGVRLSPEE